MKNLLYDLIVGGAIMMGLLAIVPIMEANQNYIRNSALTRSGTERLEMVYSDSGFEKNQYDITDVYAFVLQNIDERGLITSSVKIDFIYRNSPTERPITISFSRSLTAAQVEERLESLQGYLEYTSDKYNIRSESSNVDPIGIVKTYTIEKK